LIFSVRDDVSPIAFRGDICYAFCVPHQDAKRLLRDTEGPPIPKLYFQHAKRFRRAEILYQTFRKVLSRKHGRAYFQTQCQPMCNY
jgi:hypothetical protein